jgi:hypothetical protein
MKKALMLLTLSAALIVPATLVAEEERPGTYLKVAMTTAEKYSRDPKTVFAADAPTIYAIYRIVAAGPVKLKAVFWADAVEGLDPKTKVMEKTISISEKGEFMGAVPALKPANGWPVGAYRVELFIGDTLSKTLPFKVVKSPGGP